MILLLFRGKINRSMQVGDIVYSVQNTESVGSFTTNSVSGANLTPNKIGVITRIDSLDAGCGLNNKDWGCFDPSGSNINGLYVSGGHNNCSDIGSFIEYPVVLGGSNWGGDSSSGGGNCTLSFDSDGTLSSNEQNAWSYRIEIDDGNTPIPIPSTDSYFLFSKDNSVNVTSILGYYGEVEFKNNSTEKAELFATACDITESSK